MQTATALEPLIESAFEYAFPLHAVAATRWRAVQDPANLQRHAPNSLRHERRLADHRSRWLTAPNNDTLYSNAWLDLSQGPVRVRVGEMPAGRYWSLAFMDAFTNHFALLGQRLDGCGPVAVTLVGPGRDAARIDGRVIRAPGNDAWLFARCLVDGPEDVAQAQAMQDRIQVLPPEGARYSALVTPGAPTDAPAFLALANQALGRNPPPADEAPLLAQWAAVGLVPGAGDAWTRLDEGVRAAWSRHIGAAWERVRTSGMKLRRDMHGWVVSGPEIGDFGRNFALRASVALGGLGALPPVEAMYFVRFHDDDRQLLDGRQAYLLRVPPGGLPTDSFWSFSMYQPTADGQRFFADNPIGRYAIGNRTRGLRVNADGSLDIALQHQAPAAARLRANWLPAPAGLFQISLRAYMPRPALRDGRAALPSIVRC